ncbi:MAG: hypothetical protein ACK5LS_02820 [Propioniciclava sp.]
MKILARLLGGAVAAALLLVAPLPAAAEPTAQIELGQGAIPSGKTGEEIAVTVPLVNRGDATALGVLVSPKPSVDPATFPFEITRTDYTATAGDLAADATADVAVGTFTVRSGLASGYYALPLSIQYGNGDERIVIERTVFVQVAGVSQPDTASPKPVTTTKPQTVELVVRQPAASAGGSSAGGTVSGGTSAAGGVTGGAAETGSAASSSGGSGGSPSSSPRLMLTSFRTTPGEVIAGQPFRVSFTLTNMSSRRAVGNIKVTVASAEGSFLPATGASSLYVESIGAKRSASRSLEFTALPTLEERPHQLSVSIEYEDRASGSPLQAEEAVAVVVKQRTRAETGTVEVVPEMIAVGQEAGISFPLQNLGKVPLYNVRAGVEEGQPVTADDVFVGNIEPGASGAIDLIVHGEAATSEPVTVTITYEDASGTKSTLEQTAELMIEAGGGTDPEADEMSPEEMAGPGMLARALPVLVFLVVAGAITAAIILTRRRRRRQEQALAQQLEQADTEPLFIEDPQ